MYILFVSQSSMQRCIFMSHNWFQFWGKTAIFSQKMVNVIHVALNLYIDTNVLVYERRLMVKVWSIIKFFVLKKHFLQK